MKNQNEKFCSHCFKELISFIPIGVCFINSNGLIFEVNKKTEELLGYKKHELVGSSLEKIIQKKDIDKFLKQEIFDEEIIFIGKENQIIISAYSKKVVKEDCSSIFIALCDLSESKQKEVEVQEKIRELERFKRLATGRELKMVELKRENKKTIQENQALREKIKKIRKSFLNREYKKDEQ